MFLRYCRPNDIANHLDGALEFRLRELRVRSVGRPQLGYGTTTLKDHYPLSGRADPVKNGEAPRLEVRCIDCFHMTSFQDQSQLVKTPN